MAMIYESVKQSLKDEKLSALATVIRGPQLGKKLFIYPDKRTVGDLGFPELTKQVIDLAAEQFTKLESGRCIVTVEEQTNEVFIEVFAPLPKIFIIGAVHMAIPLVAYAKIVGFHTVVIDARASFANRDRFPHADELIVGWPSEVLEKIGIDESTCVVLLTHDDKFDNPALVVAIGSPALYIGVLGSKKTHANRLKELKDLGMTDEKLARIHAPVGLNLGARGPEEIALSIIAEIIAVKHGVTTVFREMRES